MWQKTSGGWIKAQRVNSGEKQGINVAVACSGLNAMGGGGPGSEKSVPRLCTWPPESSPSTSSVAMRHASQASLRTVTLSTQPLSAWGLALKKRDEVQEAWVAWLVCDEAVEQEWDRWDLHTKSFRRACNDNSKAAETNRGRGQYLESAGVLQARQGKELTARQAAHEAAGRELKAGWTQHEMECRDLQVWLAKHASNVASEQKQHEYLNTFKEGMARGATLLQVKRAESEALGDEIAYKEKQSPLSSALFSSPPLPSSCSSLSLSSAPNQVSCGGSDQQTGRSKLYSIKGMRQPQRSAHQPVEAVLKVWGRAEEAREVCQQAETAGCSKVERTSTEVGVFCVGERGMTRQDEGTSSQVEAVSEGESKAGQLASGANKRMGSAHKTKWQGGVSHLHCTKCGVLGHLQRECALPSNGKHFVANKGAYQVTVARGGGLDGIRQAGVDLRKGGYLA